MSKYIIDIPKTVGMGKVGSVHYTYFDGIQCQTIVLKGDEIEELNSDYINEHYGWLQDDAYERGHGIGYQKGFEDGKAVNDKGCVGCKFEGNGKDHSPCDYCCNGYSNQYQAKQTDDEIKVGDEVIYNNTIKCLVVRPETDERYAVLIDGNGYHHSADHRECKKTGRHFDISSILKEMQS